MKEEKEVKISFWAAHFTTIVSVTLVLLIIGVIAMISLCAHRETQRLKEKIEISVVMADSVGDKEANDIREIVAAKPYALNARVITKQQALENWKHDTGEDLEALFGVNPLSPEVAFTVKADYSSHQSLTDISKQLRTLPGVEEVATPESAMVESMNDNIETLSLILSCIAIVLIIISFVLINNTVHLTIYSRRFTIHTMQLVGATNSFIRRPVMTDNMLAGLIAGLFASAILALTLWLLPQASSFNISDYISWPEYGIVAAALCVIGTLLCGLAASISTTRYLRKDYDDLFN